jgi:hypothetical protein
MPETGMRTTDMTFAERQGWHAPISAPGPGFLRALFGALGASAWRERLASMLDVDVDGQTLRLTGVTSKEQAIAQIEHRLRGSRLFPTATAGLPMGPRIL